MPRTPPKSWWKKCVEGVERSGSAISAEQVCGSVWFHKLSKKDRERIVREAEKERRGRK